MLLLPSSSSSTYTYSAAKSSKKETSHRSSQGVDDQLAGNLVSEGFSQEILLEDEQILLHHYPNRIKVRNVSNDLLLKNK